MVRTSGRFNRGLIALVDTVSIINSSARSRGAGTLMGRRMAKRLDGWLKLIFNNEQNTVRYTRVQFFKQYLSSNKSLSKFSNLLFLMNRIPWVLALALSHNRQASEC